MTDHASQMFRGECHSYQGGSTIVEAASRAEAIEIERRNPFAGDDFDLHEQLENTFVVPTDAPVEFLLPAPKDKAAAGDDAGDGRPRKYLVSATYRKIYAGDISAATVEDARRQVAEHPELLSGWKLVRELAHITAEPMPEDS